MRRSLLYVFIAALQALGSIGCPLLLANYVRPAQLGVLSVCVLLILLVRSVASLGLYGPISVNLHAGDDGVQRARSLLRWSGLTSLPVAVALSVIGYSVREPAAPYVFATAGGVAGAVAMGHQALHRSITNHGAYALAVLGPTALANVMALAVTVSNGGGAVDYVKTMALVSILTAGVLHTRHVRRADRPTRRDLLRSLRIGSGLVVTSSAAVGLSLGDRPLVQALLSQAEAGRYHVTYIVAAGGIPLLAAINNAWLPTVLQFPEHARMNALGHSTAGVVRGVLLLSIGATVATPTLVRWIAGPAYVGPNSGELVAFIALGVVPYAVYSGMCIGLLSKERTRAIAVATSSGLVANLLANMVLLPVVGIVGAGVASFVGYLVSAGVSWCALGGPRAVRWLAPQLAAWSLCVVALVAATAHFLPRPEGWWGAVLVLAGGCVGFAGCLSVARSTAASPGQSP